MSLCTLRIATPPPRTARDIKPSPLSIRCPHSSTERTLKLTSMKYATKKIHISEGIGSHMAEFCRVTAMTKTAEHCSCCYCCGDSVNITTGPLHHYNSMHYYTCWFEKQQFNEIGERQGLPATPGSGGQVPPLYRWSAAEDRGHRTTAPGASLESMGGGWGKVGVTGANCVCASGRPSAAWRNEEHCASSTACMVKSHRRRVQTEFSTRAGVSCASLAVRTATSKSGNQGRNK